MKTVVLNVIAPKHSVKPIMGGLSSIGLQIVGSEPCCRIENEIVIEEVRLEITCTEEKEYDVLCVIKEFHPYEQIKVEKEFIDVK